MWNVLWCLYVGMLTDWFLECIADGLLERTARVERKGSEHHPVASPGYAQVNYR